MANINAKITPTSFYLNTNYPIRTDINTIDIAITKLRGYLVNVENCGYPERCQSTTCQSCQSCQANPNCCSNGDDDGSNY